MTHTNRAVRSSSGTPSSRCIRLVKILIVSDTHRKNENYMKVLQKTGSLDLVIHLGDCKVFSEGKLEKKSLFPETISTGQPAAS